MNPVEEKNGLDQIIDFWRPCFEELDINTSARCYIKKNQFSFHTRWLEQDIS